MVAMYRIMCKRGKVWKWGLHSYTMQQALDRKLELVTVGIECKVVPEDEVLWS